MKLDVPFPGPKLAFGKQRINKKLTKSQLGWSVKRTRCQKVKEKMHGMERKTHPSLKIHLPAGL
uniref:Uncharacterized protein n=1 Tax=Arundo donax TaxID=35708 RepID=A0A0A9GYX9_ARUDO